LLKKLSEILFSEVIVLGEAFDIDIVECMLVENDATLLALVLLHSEYPFSSMTI
jgi:hypothetical protein